MICRLHNHQKNPKVKYTTESKTTFVSGEDSLFSVLRRNGIRLISALIRGRVYRLRLRFPDGSVVVFEADRLQSNDLITRVLSKLNEICITNRLPGIEAVVTPGRQGDDGTSTGKPVFILKQTHREQR